MAIKNVGTVKWFNADKGYGFIQQDGGGPDVFVHITAVRSASLNGLKERDRIEYDVVPNQRNQKPCAENLRLL